MIVLKLKISKCACTPALQITRIPLESHVSKNKKSKVLHFNNTEELKTKALNQ